MRVHGDRIIRRRSGITKLKKYSEARKILAEDFKNICGYCGKDSHIMHERFHVDHFVPVSLNPERENDYYNLVWACPKCNLIKSNKWPTENKEIANDGNKGFVDPATEEYDKHIERNEQGYICGKTLLGRNICENLNFHIRRTDLYWKIHSLYKIQEKLEELFDKQKLSEAEKDFYIETNKLLKRYVNDAFDERE